MSEKDNGNTTKTTPPVNDSELERLKRDSFWHKMARGYFPKSYYYNAHCPGAEERIAKGELIGCVLKGTLSNTLQWVCRKAVIFCMVVSAVLLTLFFGLYLYHAFMPIMQATVQGVVAAFTGLTTAVTVAVTWLGQVGTILSVLFLTTGLFSVCVILGGLPGGRDNYRDPDKWLASLSMDMILAITGAIAYVAQKVGRAIKLATITLVGEVMWSYMPHHWLLKKLATPVIVE